MCLVDNDVPDPIKKEIAEAVQSFERRENSVEGKPQFPNVNKEGFWDFEETPNHY